MIIIFYDGKCSLCRREINHYKKIAPTGIFDWQDITKSSDSLKKAGISLCEGLKVLHAIDNHGNIHTGLNAFILIWKHLKKWRVLALFISIPLIKQVANIAYKGFAKWRFKRLSHCQLALKNKDKLK